MQLFLLLNNIVLFIIIPFLFKNVKADDCLFFENVINTFVRNGNINLVKEEFNKQNVNSCCEYEGFSCEIINNEFHLTKIKFNNLHYEAFKEATVTELSNLIYLNSLEVIDSEGSFPRNIAELVSLKYFKYKAYKFGKIPNEIGTLVNLEVLDFSDSNRLDEAIPQSICNLKQLKTIKLRNCYIEGTIPYCFKDMEKLETLDLYNNLLYGYVPLISNIKSCNYELTDLCNLNSSIYKSDKINNCDQRYIERTNRNNGIPNPNSTEFDNEIDKTVKGLYFINDHIQYFIIFVYALVISVILCTLIGFLIVYIKRRRNLNKYRTVA